MSATEQVTLGSEVEEEAPTKDPIVEFLLCLLPSYIFFIQALWRIYEIKHYGHSPKQPDLMTLRVIQLISYAMTAIHGIIWIVTYVDCYSINISRKNIDLAVLYFFPVMAWYWSYDLTAMELKRKISPMPMNQFLFWSLSIISSFIKFYMEPQVNDMVLLLDVSQIVLSITITVYFHNKEHEIFDFIDEEEEEKHDLEQPALIRQKMLSLHINEDDGIEAVENNKERLPIIEVLISKKFQKKVLPDGSYDRFFEIKTSINKEQLSKVNRSLTEFFTIEKVLKRIYTLSKFQVLPASPPTLDLEPIRNASFDENANSLTELVQSLETFLNKICEEPCLMHEVALDFLAVPKLYKSQYINFINHAQMVNSRIITAKRRSSPGLSFEMKDFAIDLMDSISMCQSEIKTVDRRKLQVVTLKAHQMRYEYSKAKRDIVFIFEVTMNKEDDSPPSTWQIDKTYGAFKLNNQRMKMEVGFDVPNLQEFVPSALSGIGESTLIFNQKMLDGLEKYLKTILTVKKLYCQSLFEFLGIEAMTLQRKFSVSESVSNVQDR